MRRFIILAVIMQMLPQQAQVQVKKMVLPNGLKVLVKEDHSSPIVAINIWFRVGSVNETDEMTGLAHFQEHMVFKGTEKYGVGEIARLVKSAGGNLNASTSYSYTMYYIVLPSRSFSLGLSVQAEAMMRSTFDPDEFQKERIVVIDEARMYDDNPEAYAFYRTMELGFKVHNYRRPIAGYEKVVRKIKREQLLYFYTTYYTPSNAVLVVVGDVDAEKALEEIKDTYGAWEDKQAEIYESPPEPLQNEFRFKVYRGSIDLAYLGIGFHIPSIKHEDYPALEMLSSLLSTGKSSRFYRRLREEKRLVTTIGSEVLAEKWPGFFQISASMPADKWAEARDAIFEEIERFKVERVSEGELRKARRQLQRTIYSELETMEGQASNLGYYEALGDYRLAEKYREAIKRVTPEEVAEVAKKYLKIPNCSLVAYLPKNASAAPTVDEVRGALEAKTTELGTSSVFQVSGKKGESRGQPVQVPPPARKAKLVEKVEVKLVKLDNGLRVLVKRRTTVPLVTMLTVIQGGARLEPKGKSGLSTLTFRSLIKGTRSYSSDEIAGLIEGLGGSVESFSSFDVAGAYVSVLSEYLDEAVPVYKEIVREPLFPHNEVEKEKNKLLEELAKRHDNPILLSIDSLFVNVFGDHPYSHPFLGDKDQLEKLTEDECRDWFERVLVPSNVVLTFVGDITEVKALEIAESLFGDMKRGSEPLPEADLPESPAGAGIHELRRKKLKQSIALVGFMAPPMLSREAVSLQVLNGILTGLGGRLFVELRDKRSLGYMAGSAFLPLKARSIFFGYANPTSEGVDEAFQVIMEELTKVAREKVRDEEIKLSKEWLIGSQIMQLQRNFSQAIAYGTYEALGFGYGTVDGLPDMIQSITKDEIIEAANGVFEKDRGVFIKLLPEEVPSGD